MSLVCHVFFLRCHHSHSTSSEKIKFDDFVLFYTVIASKLMNLILRGEISNKLMLEMTW